MATTRLVTAEDLYQFEGDQNRYDLIRGELITLPPATWLDGILGGRLAHKIASHVYDHDLGEVAIAGTGFILARDPDVLLTPDVSFIRTARVPLEEEQDAFFVGAPDLAVEIVAPTEFEENHHAKLVEYLDGGVRLLWIVQPERKDVIVYTPDRRGHALTVGEELDGGDVLPGFRLPIAEIFR